MELIHLKRQTWFVIANPTAGNGTVRRHWDKTAKFLRENGLKFEVVFTKKKGHATQQAQEAIEAGYRKIIAVGGDGTANEVVNGIFLQQACPASQITFSLLPFGTGNDWIRTHRIPRKLNEWVSFIKRGKTTFQDIGLVTYFKEGQPHQRYFINVAGLAYDAFVLKKIKNHKFLTSSKLLYNIFVFGCLWQYRLTKARLIFDEQIVEDFFYTINAGICRYSGGGLQIVPHALPDDGKLALTFAGNISKWSILRALPLFFNGKIHRHPSVHIYQVKHIKIETLCSTTTFLEVDGEFLGETPVEISILEKALIIIAP